MATLDAGLPRLFPRRGDRIIGGVAGGFADRFGVEANVVRLALALLTLVGGLGVVLYAIGALVSSPPDDDVSLPDLPPGTEHARDLAVGCITLGVLLAVRPTGLWLGDPIMAPLIVVAFGIGALAVLHGDRQVRDGGPLAADGPLGAVEAGLGRNARVRILIGVVLVATGIALIGTGEQVPGQVRVGAFATAITVLGVGVVLGPWLARLAQEAALERRERIRATEREAMAAHLHDSVLQTLALIQRTADDPRRTVALARQQERELRAWLYGAPTITAGTTLAAAVEAVVRDVEADHGMRVDAVVTGGRDTLLDADLEELVAAVREAVVNAAKHAEVDEVSVYVEVGPDRVEAFVRDRGRGFDPDHVPAGRQGIAGSIRGRMERLGGDAEIDTTPGVGTEVRLVLPREVLRDVQAGAPTASASSSTSAASSARGGTP